ncbi:MAG: undecaprenyl-diphosphate phosphatase [Planctomycetaceae bacterium]|nr:undecaprenyl-diphosphate phosphatase [Planctomycetaceae bacterium]
MSYLETIFLGVVQGIAEFLPISSSGHLTILQELMGRKLETVELNIVLHLGTLISIAVVFWHDLITLYKQPRLLAAIVVATLPLLPMGLFLKDWLEETFQATIWAGVCLCITAVLLASFRRIEHGDRDLAQIRLSDALVVGLFQAIAPLPGISRSGITIFGGMLTGLSRETAARFSFLIAIPAIGGATVLYAKDLLEGSSSGTDAGPLLAGAVVACVIGILSLRWLLRLVQTRRLWPFAVYCALVGLATIAWQLTLQR